MPRVITVDPTNLTQGHCWDPTSPESGSPDVFIKNLPIVRVGDAYIPHVPGCTTPTPTTHPVIPIFGSPNVFVNGIPIVRDGDPMGCGDVANGGEVTVFANGGGSQQGEDPDNTIGFTRSPPVLEYPSRIVDIPYYVIVQNEIEVFIAGCEFTFPLLDAYTPLTEDNGAIYRNRPGPPLTTRSGAVLPPYANPINLTPIDITISKSGDLPTNIYFYDDGSIRGRIDIGDEVIRFQGREIIIRATNHVGSQEFRLNLNFKKNYNACP